MKEIPKSLKQAVNTCIDKQKFCMFQCLGGKTYFLPHHYNYLNYEIEAPRVLIGKGVLGGKLFYYLTINERYED